MPWWGWMVAGLAVLAVGWFVGGWWLDARRERRERVDWVAGLLRGCADPVDEAYADWLAALGPRPDGSHDRDPALTDEDRQSFVDFCESMLAASEERSGT